MSKKDAQSLGMVMAAAMDRIMRHLMDQHATLLDNAVPDGDLRIAETLVDDIAVTVWYSDGWLAKAFAQMEVPIGEGRSMFLKFTLGPHQELVIEA